MSWLGSSPVWKVPACPRALPRWGAHAERSAQPEAVASTMPHSGGIPKTAIHQGFFSRTHCHTSHPPPISARPANIKMPMVVATRPGDQTMGLAITRVVRGHETQQEAAVLQRDVIVRNRHEQGYARQRSEACSSPGPGAASYWVKKAQSRCV